MIIKPAMFRNGDTVRFYGDAGRARVWGSRIRTRLAPRLSPQNNATLAYRIACDARVGRVFCTYANGDVGVMEFNGHQWRVHTS